MRKTVYAETVSEAFWFDIYWMLKCLMSFRLWICKWFSEPCLDQVNIPWQKEKVIRNSGKKQSESLAHRLMMDIKYFATYPNETDLWPNRRLSQAHCCRTKWCFSQGELRTFIQLENFYNISSILFYIFSNSNPGVFGVRLLWHSIQMKISRS